MARQLEPEDPISLRARAFVIGTLARATADRDMVKLLRRLEGALLDAAQLVEEDSDAIRGPSSS
jgi:hypothetical protein